MCLTPEVAEALKPRRLFELAGAIGAERVAAARQRLDGLKPEERRQRLRQEWARLLGDVEPKAAAQGESHEPGRIGDGVIEGGVLGREPRITVLVVLLLPPHKAEAKLPVGVGLAQEGKKAFLQQRAESIASLLKGGVAVCLPDVRGTGETRPGDDRGRTGADTAISSTELML